MTGAARFALAAVAGALAALAFPAPGWWPLAFVAWAPLLVALTGVRARRGAALGLVAGLVFWAIVLRWLAGLSIWGWLALALYVSLYLAAFGAVAARLLSSSRGHAVGAVAAAWVALEGLRGWLFTGFGWGAMGYALAPAPRLAQLASVGGVPLLSLCLMATNVALARAWPPLRRRDWGGAWPHLALVIALPLLMAAHGTLVLAAAPEADSHLRVAVVQGDVSPLEKWERRGVYTAFTRYTTLSTGAATAHPDLIVWPETAIPVPLDPDSRHALRARAIERGVSERWHAALLFGVPERSDERPGAFLNSARLLRPDGVQLPAYHKQRLVPFGEYTPLPALFSGLPKMVSGPEFVAGHGGAPFPVAGARVGVLICFEDVFPGEAADRAADADVLAVITNDAWFGPVGEAQHRDITALRAIETRRAVARAANTGISELVDPYGRLLARAPRGPSSAVADLPRSHATTLAARAPAAVPLLCGAVALLFLLLASPLVSRRVGRLA